MDYTKGPWYANKIYDSKRGIKAEYCIASNSGPICGIRTSAKGCVNTVVANARLISAAPDMYEALKDIITAIKSGQERIGAGRQSNIEAALNKAEGK